MELNISKFFNSCSPSYYSASRAELGDDAGSITWENALDLSEKEILLKTPEKVDAFVDFVRSSGGWTEEEIAAWSLQELNALLIQWISGDMRECEVDANSTPDEWEACYERQRDGQAPSNIYRGDDGQVYFYLGI